MLFCENQHIFAQENSTSGIFKTVSITGHSGAHLYSGVGSYKARLTVSSDNGCTNRSNGQIEVHPVPVASFTVVDPICITNTSTITFTGTAGGLVKEDKDKNIEGSKVGDIMYPETMKDSKFPFMRYYFEKAALKVKLKSFDFERSSEETYSQDEHFLSLSQLKVRRDSAVIAAGKTKVSQYHITRNKFSVTRGIDDSTRINYDSIVASSEYFTQLDSMSRKQNILRAIDLTRGLVNSQKVPVALNESSNKYIMRKDISWHQKFTLSYACMMLLVLGSSLGAIVKKGGLGIPIAVAIALFIVYYIISITGQRLGTSLIIPPYIGMWLSSIVLLPFGAILTYQAVTESKVLDFELYGKFFKKIISSTNFTFIIIIIFCYFIIFTLNFIFRDTV